MDVRPPLLAFQFLLCFVSAPRGPTGFGVSPPSGAVGKPFYMAPEVETHSLDLSDFLILLVADFSEQKLF